MSPRAFVLSLVLLAPALQGSGPAAAQEQRLVILENADSLVGLVIGNENARELIGNVRIRQDNVRITCDHALQMLQSGTVTLTGNVVVHDDSMTFRAPRGVYHRDDRRAEGFDGITLEDGVSRVRAREGEYLVDRRLAHFRGNVVVTDTATTVLADTLTYAREGGRSDATGWVRVITPRDRMSISGGRLLHLAAARYSRMTVDPLLEQVDTTGGRRDTLRLRADTLEAFRDSTRLLIATDSVRFIRGTLAGRARRALFFAAGDSILLRHSPVLWYDSTQLTGDSITVLLAERKLRTVLVRGDAMAVTRSQDPARFDQLTGTVLTLRFGAAGLERIEADERAVSLYHLYDDSTANGVNRSSGDRIAVRMREGRVGAIAIAGGVQGDYFPENMVRGREATYALPGGAWRPDRPERRAFVVVPRPFLP
jgi:lipopolysaccharide export system protein LptA